MATEELRTYRLFVTTIADEQTLSGVVEFNTAEDANKAVANFNEANTYEVTYNVVKLY